MKTVDDIKEKLNCTTDDELGALFFRKKAAVSVWRKNGVPGPILKRAQEILDERTRVADPQQEYGGESPRFQVVQHIGTETKKPTNPVVQGIIGIVEAMTPEQQIEAFKALSKLFTASQTTEKS